MKTKGKRIIGILFSLALMFAMTPVLGLSQSAYAGMPISVNPENSGSVGVSYDSERYTLTATASEGKAFDHWSYLNDDSPETALANPWTVDKNTLGNFSNITAHFVDAYPLWVGGTQVTSVNKDDVLKGTVNAGKVSFTPAKDGDPAKLTLNGANITAGYYDEEYKEEYGIYYTAKEPLIIESPSGADNKISNIEAFDTGIRAEAASITLSGKGKLTAEASYRGIKAHGITIDGNNVTAIGTAAIGSATDVVITGGNVTAAGMFTGIYTSEGDITIKDGDVTATGQNVGIDSYGNVIVDGGTIEASGMFGLTGENITVNGGTVNATGTDSHIEPTGMSTMKTANPAGIWADGAVEIKGGKVIAAGDGYGILGTVKNNIDGTAWTDKAGTAGKTAIAINTDGQDLAAYKKVQFPAKVDPEPTPTPTPTPSKVSGTATAKMSAKGKTGMTLAWSKIQGAAGYDIYLARCDAKGKHSVLKKVKTIKGNKTFKWTKTGLKKGKSYKACVKAFVYKNGKKSYVKTSPVLHAYSGNVMGKYTNAKSIKVNKTKVVLKKGKAFKVKAKVTKVKKNKKLMPKSHVKTVRYLSTNKKVATVSASGKITAKGKGSCTVIAFAHNGISKSIKVTVK